MPESAAVDVATDADFELGHAALLEITSAESIGDRLGSIDEGDGVVTVYFETLLSGYPGWRWTVSIAHIDGEAPTALETELTPGDDALLSPAWIPWVDRLADYRAAQDGAAAEDASDDDSDDHDHDHDSDDDDSDDDDDDDDLGSDVLHGGDLDGVDIDDHIEDDDELAAPADGVDESDDADDESGDAGPQPPDVAGGGEWAEHDQEHDKSY